MSKKRNSYQGFSHTVQHVLAFKNKKKKTKYKRTTGVLRPLNILNLTQRLKNSMTNSAIQE